MRTLPLLALAGMTSCGYSLQGEVLNIRAEIATLERTVPEGSPLWIFEGPDRFDQFVEDFSARIPDYIQLHLLRKLNAMSVGEAEALSQGDFDRAECVRDPARFRGRVWRATGVVVELHGELTRVKGFPVRQYHSGIFFDTYMLPVLFHVVQKPEVLMLREDQVEVRGVFVKMIEYTTKSGRQVVAPFFVAKVLRRFV